MAEPVDSPAVPLDRPNVLQPDSPAVAVLVTRDPGPSFEDALASLAAQDHPAFSILVIDDGSVEPITARVAAIVPSAFVRRQDQPTGYGASANLVRTMVSGAGVFVFCHDDVALAPDAIRLLTAEAVRSGAAIVGPKLVAWTNHDRLLAVGLGLDRAGNAVSLIDRDERDQGQHDVAGEVVAVSGAVLLIRTEVFEALDGFDEDATTPVVVDAEGARGSRASGAKTAPDSMSLGPDLGEDVDLCWRARISGHVIAIEPSARVAHLGLVHGARVTGTAGTANQSTNESDEPTAAPDVSQNRRSVLYRERNRIRSMLVTASGARLPFIVPVMIAQTLWRMVSPRHRETGASQGFAAWRGALRDVGALRARRSGVQVLRKVADRDDLRRLVPIGARARAAFRADVSADSARLWNLAEQATASTERARRVRLGALGGGLLLWLVGSRGLIGAGVASVQQFAPLSASEELLRATVHTGAAGDSSAASLGVTMLGVLTTLLLGAHGMAQVALTAGMLIVGALTIWRLTGHLLASEKGALLRGAGLDRSARRTPQGLVAAAYCAGGLGVQAIGAGRLDAIVTYGLLPLALLRLLRAVDRRTGGTKVRDASPTPERIGSPVSRFAHRVAPVAPLGAVLAILFSFSPGAIVAFLLAAFGLALTDFRSSEDQDHDAVRSRRVIVTTAFWGVLFAAGLLLPWTVDLVRPGRTWSQFTGGDVARTISPRLFDLLRLSARLTSPSLLTWGLVGAAVVALLIGSGAHLRIVLRGWCLLVASALVLWCSGRGWLGALVPHPMVMLVPAAIGLAIAAGLGAAVFADDVRSQRFGWRQVISIGGFVVFVLSLIPAVGAVGGGRWGLPERSARESLSWIDTVGGAGRFRTLWIGSPRVLPLAAWSIDHDLAVGISTDGLPQAGDQWLARRTSSVVAALETVQHVRHGETSRAGGALAQQGIRYVVVVNRSAPSGRRVGPTGDVTAALVRQFDLRPIEAELGVSVFENASWTPLAEPDSGAPAGTTPLRAIQGVLWIITLGLLGGQRRRRRSHESLLLDQERNLVEPEEERIGDLFTTSFAGDDDDVAFAEFVAKQASRTEPTRHRRRRVTIAAPGRPMQPGARGVARDVDVTELGAEPVSDLPEDGSLADELWSQWSERQAGRTGASRRVDANRHKGKS